MKTKKMICPCCDKEIKLPYRGDVTLHYSSLINEEYGFYDLVDICPECGYTMLFDNGISDEMKEYVKSDEYRNILLNPKVEEGLKKWMLIAMLSEYDENYTEAGIEYMKAYDYLEYKDMPLDKRLIEKAASCFLSAVEEYTSFVDAILAVDCMRRAGEMKQAARFLNITKETFTGELVDKLVFHEDAWILLNQTQKRILYYLNEIDDLDF